MKRKISVYTLLTAAVLAFITTVGAPRAYATSDIYPGEMCLKWSGAGTPKYFYGSIGNTSPTDWLYIDCPVVTPWLYKAVQSGNVAVRDLNPTYGIQCTLYSVWNGFSDGSYYAKTGGTKASGGAGSSPQQLSFSGVGLNGGSSSSGAPAYTISVTYFSCAVPPSSSGANSYIIEYDVFNGD